MCEDLGGGPVGELDASIGDGLGGVLIEESSEFVAFEDGAEVVVHAFGLFEGSAEGSDLDAGFEDEVECGGESGVEGFAGAACGPDDGVSWGSVAGSEVGGVGFEEGVAEVVEGGAVSWCEGVSWHDDAECVSEPGVELRRCGWGDEMERLAVSLLEWGHEWVVVGGGLVWFWWSGLCGSAGFAVVWVVGLCG